MLTGLLLMATLSAPALGNPYDDAPSLIPAHSTEDPFSWELSSVALQPGQPGRITATLIVPPGTHVYRDQLEVSVANPDGLRIGKPDFPPGLTAPDPANKAMTRELYERDVIIYLPVNVPKKTEAVSAYVQLQLRHQGCREGLCFPPSDTMSHVLIPIRTTEAP